VSVSLLAALPHVAQAATLGGRLVDPEGRGVTNAQVVVTSGLGTVAETRSDASGEFEFSQLPDGRYDVRVIAEGFQAAPQTVTLSGEGRRELTVQLALAAIRESIVVSAAQIETTRSTAPASVTVITSTDLRAQQVESVSDALRHVPGLTVTRGGGRGAITSLFPRGGASNYTLVLVDGIRANSFGGAYDFAHLSVANVDRVEIVRGPQSALYGAEAVGAVVQVITARGGAAHVDGLVEGGNQGTLRATAGASGSHRGWSWGFGAERAQSDGYTGTTAAGEAVSNDDYTRNVATGTLSYQRPQRLDVTIAGTLAKDERGFPGPWGSDPIGAFTGVDRISRGTNDVGRIGARVTHPWTASLRQRLEANYADLSSDFISPFGPSSSGTKRFDGRVQEDVIVSPVLSASGGVEFVDEQGDSTYVTGAAGTPIPIKRNDLGVFGEARLSGSARLSVTGGVRLEHLTRDGVEADPFAFQPRPAFAEQTVNSVNPKIAASYLLSPPGASATTRVRASAGTGIRPPDAFEIAFTDNPDLKPERSRSFEAGLEQQLAAGAVALDAVFFANRYDDLIVTVGTAIGGASRYRSDNISNARARGLELSGRVRLPHGLQANASYTWLSTEILSVDGLGGVAPPPFAVGDPLLRRPSHQGSVDLSYTMRRLTAFAALTSRGRILDAEPNYGTFGGLFFSPGYAVFDIGASAPVWRGIEVFGRLNNVADRSYEEVLGYPALGRNGLVGVRVAAGR